MTKAVLEAETESDARQTAARVPSPARAVPASLHASLMARLDRLGPAKEVAQIGAAVGREFSHSLLAAVVRKPEAELQSALDHDAVRCIGEAITAVETTGERWCEAEINRIAGEIALISPQRDATKAATYFDQALAVARTQQAKSWELRAAMSMARLWRDQGKPQQARELLAPLYGWFTEGFDTLDLKEAKALLDELSA
jgi:predicted ATPase